MTWDEFLDTPVDTYLIGQTQTDIECPECGRFIYLDTTVTLASDPPQYKYWCPCGWVGNSYLYWRE